MTRKSALAALLPLAAAAPPLHDVAALNAEVRAFAGPGARPLDPRLALPACPAAPELAWTPGGRAVAVSCAAPRWRVLAMTAPAAPAPGGGVVAARPIARGAVLTAADLRPASGAAPAEAAAALTAAVGRMATRAIAAGAPVRSGALAPPLAVRRGGGTPIRAQAPGILVEAAGTALADAPAGGAVTAVNSATGRRLRGVAAADGAVAVGP